MSASSSTLSECFLRLGHLPQCEAVFSGGPIQGACFVNLLTGQLVGRQVTDNEEGAREITALLVSCLPFEDAQGNRRANVSLNLAGAQKLVRVWEQQAQTLGLS